ncbi:hypothetical protein EI546_06295 [Aequorivita sp. H23M31]|uniref:Glycosyltransferase RgtA/B/C/D-like domain-containing protein n=1 Tax=Aequorivita ciconiae TaxID=2494375 RepID=A0A410G286_9FLAO|nr:hypothetical protein [Aequorivita sp. H23M31]QAA81360.1 hypothetical protein EI546_06295 [Aequorivita sp. H23M31]
MKDKKQLFFLLLLNILIAAGFYLENKNAGFTSLVSDVHSIVGIAQKFDDPQRYKYDLFLNDFDNVKYYTPFFVQPLRFVAYFMDYNYVQALNIISFFLHLIYGLLWFFLFYKLSRNFWISLIMSLLIRGIIWLPGYEFWGITGIWTTMPRTVYIVFMPLILLLLFHFKEKHLWLSAFVAGFIFNFHPITGLGGILIYLTIIVYFYFRNRKTIDKPIQKVILILGSIILGMLPFILTYFGQTSSVINYDLGVYQNALNARLPASFFDPIIFLKSWNRISALFFLTLILTYFVVSLFKKSERKRAFLLVTLTLALIIIPNISVYIEQGINALFNRNLRISFQFIRLQKLAILPGYFALLFLFLLLKPNKITTISSFFIFLLIVSLSNGKMFNSIPFVGDDIFRTILPNSLNIYNHPSLENNAMEKMLDYIRKNTPEDAVFYGPQIIRSATMRSVVLDSKGASILIEGNPTEFTDWLKDRNEFRKLEDQNSQIEFLMNKNVNYIVDDRERFNLIVPVFKVGHLKLYQL